MLGPSSQVVSVLDNTGYTKDFTNIVSVETTKNYIELSNENFSHRMIRSQLRIAACS